MLGLDEMGDFAGGEITHCNIEAFSYSVCTMDTWACDAPWMY